MRLNRIIPLLSLCVVLSTQVVAETEQEAALEACILKKIQQDNNSKTVAQLKAECEEQVEGKDIAQLRTAAERATAFNPYVITPHKMNYTLPFLLPITLIGKFMKFAMTNGLKKCSRPKQSFK